VVERVEDADAVQLLVGLEVFREEITASRR